MKYFFVLWLIFAVFTGFTQELVVSNNRQNILVAGKENPMQFAFNRCYSNQVKITTNNGVIKRNGGFFTITPLLPGSATISFSYKLSAKSKWLYRVFLYRVKSRIENTGAFLGDQRNDSMPMASILAQQGIILTNFSDVEAPMPVTGFEITLVYKKKGEVVTLLNASNQFSEKVRDALAKLEPNDFISFTDIRFTANRYSGVAEPFYIVAK